MPEAERGGNSKLLFNLMGVEFQSVKMKKFGHRFHNNGNILNNIEL